MLFRSSRTTVTLAPAGVTARFVLVANLSPWTYLGARPIDPQPRAVADQALTVYAPTRATLGSLTRLGAALLTSSDLARLPSVWTSSDLPRLELYCDTPLWLQADGEVLGQVTQVAFDHVRAALTVVCGKC